MAEYVRKTWVWPNLLLQHVWFGTSIATQADANERLPYLLQCPGNLWVSIEPLQEAITLRPEWLAKLGWVTLGGGPFPINPQWVRNIQGQCQATGVAFDFKQWGSFRPATEGDRGNTVCYPFAPDGQPMVCVGKKAAGCVLDGKTWHQFPQGRQT